MATKRKSKSSLKSDPMFANFKGVSGMTDNQDYMIEDFRGGLSVVAVGSAGTGKTYVATSLALEELVAGRASRIIFIRSAVATRDIGFLPGTEDEKMAVYEQTFITIVNELVGRGDAYQILKAKGAIEFHSSSFLRGATFRDAVIVADEIANFNKHEMHTLMSRVGENTRMLLTGDIRQCDLNARSESTCVPWLLQVSALMGDYMSVIEFDAGDIVRSGFCKSFIVACESIS